MSDEAPGDGDWGDQGYSSWYARVTGVGSSIGQAIVIPLLAVFTALLIGAFIIAVTDVDTLPLWGSDPGEAFRLSGWRPLGGAFPLGQGPDRGYEFGYVRTAGVGE